MQKTCTGEFCLSYWRKCDDALHPRKCTLVVDFGYGRPAFYTIEASSDDAFKMAGQNLQFNTKTPVLLAAMNQEGEGAEAPIIRDTSSQPPPF